MVGLGCVLRLEEDLEEHCDAPKPGEKIGQAESAADGAYQQTAGNLFQEASDPGEEQGPTDPYLFPGQSGPRLC